MLRCVNSILDLYLDEEGWHYKALDVSLAWIAKIVNAPHREQKHINFACVTSCNTALVDKGAAI